MGTLSIALNKGCKLFLQNKDGSKLIYLSSNNFYESVVKRCSFSSIFDTPFLTSSQKGNLNLKRNLTFEYKDGLKLHTKIYPS